MRMALPLDGRTICWNGWMMLRRVTRHCATRQRRVKYFRAFFDSFCLRITVDDLPAVAHT